MTDPERPQTKRGEGRHGAIARLVDGRDLMAGAARGDKCGERWRGVVHADRIAEGDLESAICPRHDNATVGRDETALVGAELKRQQSAVTAAPDRLFGLLGDRRLVCVDGHVLNRR